IVPWRIFRYSSYTPAAENVVLHQRSRHALRLNLISDTGKEALTGVRCFDATRFLFSVKCQHKCTEAGIPEYFVELSFQRKRLLFPCSGLRIAVEHFREV